MGQYFIFVNVDKKEYFDPSLPKLWEICANNDCRILPYLLADKNKGGTSLVRSVKKEDAKKLDRKKWKVVFENRDFGICIVERVTKYFGRWSGDRIVVAGDYGESKLYEKVMRGGYKNITKEATEEFNDFIGLDELKVGRVEMIMPDLIIR